MRKSRVIAGLVGVGAVLALAVGSATVAIGAPPPKQASRLVAAPAAVSEGSVELASGRGVVDFGTRWYMHSVPFEFSVTTGVTGSERAEGATVFVSWPDELVMIESAGDRWDCAAVEGGVECSNPDVIAPDEFWPVLTLDARGTATVKDSIDVYLRGVGSDEAHAGIPFTFNTGT